MRSHLHYSVVVLLTGLTAGCGGGGGGTVPQASTPNPYEGYDFTTGNTSTKANAEDALLNSGSALLPYEAPYGAGSYSSVSAANLALNGSDLPIASRDTKASQAWDNGWTGLGVKVGIADRFDSNGQINTHGDWVSLVVGSVAPESTLNLQNAFGLDVATSLPQFFTAYENFDTAGVRLVNASWGIDKAERTSSGGYTGNLLSGFDEAVTAVIDEVKNGTVLDPHYADTLYVYAAGNGADYCDSKLVSDCNFFAVIFSSVYGEGLTTDYSVLFVGALEDGSDTIASYSYQAGDMKDHFIVANDDVLSLGDAAGTSFAAPRVTGAAALLKHKFPNLEHNQIKQLLLLTADDLGAPGVDTLYGHGKLNILNALSPQGAVVPQ